ncbi:MAG: M24 family metallopeptidase [Dehalococcoidia bacterium]
MNVELEYKLRTLRETMSRHALRGIRMKGTDWFSWTTCGADNSVLLSSETGVAEVLVTETDAWVLTDNIEAKRLLSEQLAAPLGLAVCPWNDTRARQEFVDEKAPGLVASDRPSRDELSLPGELLMLRRYLQADEVKRYVHLGRETAEAVTDAISCSSPDWTEYDLSAAASAALWHRGIQPALTVAAGHDRILAHRHPLPTRNLLGERAMLVVCGRRHGLYANLTRFVYFRRRTWEEERASIAVGQVESVALEGSEAHRSLGEIYRDMAAGYETAGYPGAEREHHQGGITGYLSRDILALPSARERVELSMAVAWNPSVSGSKIEDTALVTEDGIELLTTDERWPVYEVAGRPRPLELYID